MCSRSRVQPDGKVLAGGDFFGASSIGGQTRNHIARLDPNTGLADFSSTRTSRILITDTVETIVVQGRTERSWSEVCLPRIGGQTRNYIARLDSPPGAADSFDPNANELGLFESRCQADGKVLVGGDFSGTHIGGTVTQSRRPIRNRRAARPARSISASYLWQRLRSPCSRMAGPSSVVSYHPFSARRATTSHG